MAFGAPVNLLSWERADRFQQKQRKRKRANKRRKQTDRLMHREKNGVKQEEVCTCSDPARGAEIFQTNTNLCMHVIHQSLVTDVGVVLKEWRTERMKERQLNCVFCAFTWWWDHSVCWFMDSCSRPYRVCGKLFDKSRVQPTVQLIQFLNVLFYTCIVQSARQSLSLTHIISK